MVSKTRKKPKCAHCGEYFNSEMRLKAHLLESIDARNDIIMALGRAVVELDTIAYRPPSGETQQMISRVKNILLKNDDK
jgi:hypothetical protein